MLAWWLQTGPEKAELRELNERLHDYVCRVRELERENRLLEDELRGQRGQEGAWTSVQQARFAQEARGLRRQLDELSWATAQAESERDALRRELAELQGQGREVRAARGRLDAELGAQQRELQEALAARADLEALLGRLEAERQHLAAAHERDVRELRARHAHLRSCSVRVRTAKPPLREVQAGCERLVAAAWDETVQLYEEQVRELSEVLLRGQEDRCRAEEEARRGAQEAEALRREVLELEQLREHLEDELLRMHQAYELQAEERQRTIDCLEEEKAALTLAMADRLRDCQELVQVKTGLSLEVATYRALLEGESNPDLLILTERLERLPQEFRKSIYKYTTSPWQRENQRNLLSSQKASWTSSYRPRQADPATRRGISSSFTTTADTYRIFNGETNLQTFPPSRGLLKLPAAVLETSPRRPGARGAKTGPLHIAREVAVVREPSPARRADGTAKERVVVLERKVETQGPESRRGEKTIESKERASEARNLQWEGLTKLDKEARQRAVGQLQEKTRERTPERPKSEAEREVLIPVRAPRDRDRSPARAPEASPEPQRKAATSGAGAGTGASQEQSRSRLGSPTGGDPTTQALAEHIVSGILQQLAGSPEPGSPTRSIPDTKVTYVGREERPDDGTTQTEIVVESKQTEEVDVSDKAGLDALLNTDTLEAELMGGQAERLIGDLVQRGLQGRARVVNVEIVEESRSYSEPEEEETAAGAAPFRVEEVDSSPGSGDEMSGLVWGGPRGERARRQLPGKGAPVEGATQVGEWVRELSYFVSTPDDQPGDHEDEEGSVYGQVHVEDEAAGSYSWRDELVPGAGQRGKRDDVGKEVGAGPAPWKERSGSGQVRAAESVVIEKEMRVHTSAGGTSSWEPGSRMKEVLGQLEENLPERMRTELSTIAREAQGGPGTVSVDVQKVQAAGGGGMTFVAEVNLSRTLDAHQVDLEELDRAGTGEVERAVQAVVRESLARRRSPEPSSPPDHDDREIPGAGVLFKRWATQELYSPSTESGTGKATVEVSSWARSPVRDDEGPTVKRIEISPSGIWRTEPGSPKGSGTEVVRVDVRSKETAGARSPQTRIFFPTSVTVDVPDPRTWRDTGGGKEGAATGGGPLFPRELGKELAKSVQSPRTEDQGPVVSGEKKVALLYLDDQEEQDEGHWF
ncbi:synemin [Sorex fumeus]|uniref:synemin n=1 Tax=Sorex fumeus TaxID=62283 RepID=UPI0024AE6F8A|nr:synemin [Sorex fumeus]